MPRRMSCSLTIDAVRTRTKTVTRRHAGTWTGLKAGDRLTLVEKAMGLPKGTRQVVLAEVEVTDVRVEPLHLADAPEVALEGLGHMEPWAFHSWWRTSHGVRLASHTEWLAYQVRRIEWRYLDDEGGTR